MNTKPWPILTPTGLDTVALSIPLRTRKPWTFTVGDVFALPPERCAAAFGVMAATPQHRYVVESGPGAAGWFEWVFDGDIHAGRDAALRSVPTAKTSCKWVPVGGGEPDGSFEPPPPWPLPNVHLSTPECSTQAELDERAELLYVPAARRVLALTPTEALDVAEYLTESTGNCGCSSCEEGATCAQGRVVVPPFDLVTVRGGTAPVHPDWIRSVRDQCAAAGVAFRFEGWGEWAPVRKGEPTPEEWGTLDGAGNWFPLTTLWNGRTGDASPEREVVMARYGAKASGRLIDGVTHDGEVPPC